jgi:hypothetical protein
VLLCYECAQATSHRPTTELHHVIGKENDPDLVIEVPGNEHRALSDLQQDWPAEIRHNPGRDPLLVLAALCRSLKDHLQLWVDLISQVASWLVALSKRLQADYGIRWWEVLAVGTFYSVA